MPVHIYLAAKDPAVKQSCKGKTDNKTAIKTEAELKLILDMQNKV